MKGTSRTTRTTLLFAMLALSATACDRSTAAAGDAAQQQAQATAAGDSLAISGTADSATSADLPPVDVADAVAAGFDIAALPASTAELGALPYFSIPDGYSETPRQGRRLEHGEAAFWVGDRFETVEGQVHALGMRVARDAGKDFSATEIARNIEHAVTAAGGVKVYSGEEPSDARQDKAIQAVMRDYPPEAKCLVMHPVDVYVLRRDDGNVWVRACSGRHFSGLIVLRERALVPTSALLPADALRAKIDADGRVAIQVNFAVDKADILPASQPQVDQVLQLLRDDPALRLSIDGHTDASGDAADNQRLSEARAKAVVAALTTQGIAAERLQAKGHGQAQPVADNATEEGKARNRRVELVKR
ncbi:OmpA family protein [Luteimonas sp. MC1828]|uniref:OmpA family protein n=1 Tax=Luteimonas sp. MC1828 TaxID=2799787 RepID=UPI0018F1A9FF|nr:OmpA family protein [Luteimonas sp. MC1828]MBJ7575534.1 OmpA family protein [Luteimonas sp. MC1828]